MPGKHASNPRRPRSRQHSGAQRPRIKRQQPKTVRKQERLAKAGQAGRAPRLSRTPRASGSEDKKSKSLLRGMLGSGALKPPQTQRGMPTTNPWSLPLPSRLPKGQRIAAQGLRGNQIESVHPPSRLPDSKGAHGQWIKQGQTLYYRDGAFLGRLDAGQWSWMAKTGGHWWLWSTPGNPPLLWSQNHWWINDRGRWILLHDGQAWGYEFMNDWGQEGFENESGTKILYSHDGSRILVSTPKSGAALFDAQNGMQIGRWEPETTPLKLHPHLPSPSSVFFN